LKKNLKIQQDILGQDNSFYELFPQKTGCQNKELLLRARHKALPEPQSAK